MRIYKGIIPTVLILFPFLLLGQVKDDQKSLQIKYTDYDQEFEYIIEGVDKSSFGGSIELIEYKSSRIKVKNIKNIYTLTNYKFVKTDEGKYNLHILMPPLSPNKYYTIGIRTKFGEQEIKNLINLKIQLNKAKENLVIKDYLEIEDRLIYRNPSNIDLINNIYAERTKKCDLNAHTYFLSKWQREFLNIVVDNYSCNITQNEIEKRLSSLLKDYFGIKEIEKYSEAKDLYNITKSFLEKLKNNASSNSDPYKQAKKIIMFFDTCLTNIENFKDVKINTYNLSYINKNKIHIPDNGELNISSINNYDDIQACFVELSDKFPEIFNKYDKTFNDIIESREIYKNAIYKFIKLSEPVNNSSDKVNKNSINNLIQGNYSLKDFPKKTDSTNFSKRYSNLSANIDYLNTCDLLCVALKVNEKNRSSMLVLTKALEKNKKQIEDSIKSIKNDEFLYTYNWSKTSTDKFNVKTNIEHIVFPDYGVVYSYIDDHIARPYVGISVGFPINKNVDYRTLINQMQENGINKPFFTWFRYHIRMSIGTTIGSIKQDNVRDDLFNSTNLLLGCSYTIHNYIRISTGAMFYNEYEHPLNDKKSLSYKQYYSFSLNLDLKKISDGIAKFF